MTVIYIILAVILAILLVLAIALVSPLFVRILYRETLEVYAGLSFVKIRIFPKKEKKQRRKSKSVKSAARKADEGDETKAGEKSGKSSGGRTNSPKEKKSVKDTLLLITDLIKSFLDVMGKRATFKVDVLKAVVSRPDAADTAVQFALCQGAVSTLLALSSEFSKSKINSENVIVTPDFITGKSSLEADISLSAPAGSLLFGILAGYLRNISR